jgi:monoamine oxidase
MKRREVIQKLAYTVPAGMAFPTLLSSCDQSKITPTPVYDGNVIVIGAGASGLYTAQQFLDKNIKVKVLEASDRYGGRIRLQKEFFDFPMEEGADWVYGNDNLWYSTIESSNATLIDYTTNPVYKIDGVIKTEEELANDVDFLTAMNFINDIPNYNGPDLTMINAAFSAGLQTRVHHIVDAITSNERGSSYESVSIKGVSDGQKVVADGEGRYFSSNHAHVNLLGGAYNQVVSSANHLTLNTPIVQVDYSDINTIKLTDGNGEIHECTILIVTVPISVLKSGDINFVPNLPINTTAAMNRIGMDTGYKVMLGFYVNFWGKEVSSIYTDGVAPEYYAPGKGRSLHDENRILSALIMGKQAEALEGKTDVEIIQLLLDELDELYDGEASQQFDITTTYVTNWGDKPYIKGVKSYPLVSGTGAAQEYARPINDRLFFAGEATALNGNYGTVQGALESAERVVKEVLEVIL